MLLFFNVITMKAKSYNCVATSTGAVSFATLIGAKGHLVIKDSKSEFFMRHSLAETVDLDLSVTPDSVCLLPVLPELLHVMLKSSADTSVSKESLVCATGQVFERKKDGRKFIWAAFWHKDRMLWFKKPLWLDEEKENIVFMYYQVSR